MEYITIDMDLADRILPSYCCVSVITWEDGNMKDVYSSYIYPDCDIEDFMLARHGITNKDVDAAPTMSNVWCEISKIIEGKLVFFVNGSKDVDMLLRRLDVDYLETPSFNYGSIISICKRTWDNLSKYDFATITSELGISTSHYNSLNDAIAMGMIINRAMEYHNAEDVTELFNKIGYAGGYVIGCRKVTYKALKDKKSKEYYPRVMSK